MYAKLLFYFDLMKGNPLGRYFVVSSPELKDDMMLHIPVTSMRRGRSEKAKKRHKRFFPKFLLEDIPLS